jgi:hypothetical protein
VSGFDENPVGVRVLAKLPGMATPDFAFDNRGTMTIDVPGKGPVTLGDNDALFFTHTDPGNAKEGWPGLFKAYPGDFIIARFGRVAEEGIVAERFPSRKCERIPVHAEELCGLMTVVQTILPAAGYLAQLQEGDESAPPSD